MIVVHPGNIISKNDGDRHYISFSALCRLWKLDPNKCINAENQEALRGLKVPEDARHYFPDSAGRYKDD